MRRVEWTRLEVLGLSKPTATPSKLDNGDGDGGDAENDLAFNCDHVLKVGNN